MYRKLILKGSAWVLWVERVLGYLLEVCGSTRTRGYTQPDPYPRVRVGSGTGTTSTGIWVYGFTRNEHGFSRFWSENLFISTCFLNYSWWSNCSMAREKSILLGVYNRLLT